MTRTTGILLLALATLNSWPSILLADYTLVLKNGRRITIQSYREEGGMIKFHGLGGEIGITKDQIQAILKTGEGEQQGLSISRFKAPSPPPSEVTRPGSETAQPPSEKPSLEPKETVSPEKRLAEERAKEEKEYQKRLRDINAKIQSLTERYSLITRGTTSREPGLLTSEEAIRARSEDLTSRFRDVQHNPEGPSDAGGVRLLAPSPFAGAPPTTTYLRSGGVVPRVDTPPPAYSETERELSDLRKQIAELEKERERLIAEMRMKNFQTGSLFLQ